MMLKILTGIRKNSKIYNFNWRVKEEDRRTESYVTKIIKLSNSLRRQSDSLKSILIHVEPRSLRHRIKYFVFLFAPQTKKGQRTGASSRWGGEGSGWLAGRVYTSFLYTREIKQEKRGRVINNNSWVQQAATCFQPGEVRGPIQTIRLAQRSISFKYGRQQILPDAV